MVAKRPAYEEGHCALIGKTYRRSLRGSLPPFAEDRSEVCCAGPSCRSPKSALRPLWAVPIRSKLTIAGVSLLDLGVRSFRLFSSLGIVNSVFGIALAHCLFNLPISIWILQGFISAIPKEMDETAFLDGYTRPRFIWQFLLPQIAPGIAVTAFFCFMFSWVEVVFARILTTTNGKPISMAINALFGFQTDIGLVMAVTVASMVPGAVLLFAMRSHLSRGFKIGQV